jgi:hypothetical protein
MADNKVTLREILNTNPKKVYKAFIDADSMGFS